MLSNHDPIERLWVVPYDLERESLLVPDGSEIDEPSALAETG